MPAKPVLPFFGDPKSKKTWQWVAREPIHFVLRIYGREYDDQYFSIRPNGSCVIKPGYASDGCTPKWDMGPLGIRGISDGRMELSTGYPVTYRAFMVHDALLQYRDVINIKTHEAHNEFCREIKRAKFYWSRIYCRAVRWFGPRK